MDIYSRPGQKVMFLNEHGYDNEREHAATILDTETVYHVRDIDVGSWCSSVELVEFPGLVFNTVMFKNV